MVLTAEEKRVILFVVIAFLLGLAVKFDRDGHPEAHPGKDKHAVTAWLNDASG
jgi:hypothetical protein